MMLEEMLQPRLIQGKRVLKAMVFTLLTVAVLFSFSRAAWGNLVLACIAMLGVMSIRRGGGDARQERSSRSPLQPSSWLW